MSRLFRSSLLLLTGVTLLLASCAADPGGIEDIGSSTDVAQADSSSEESLPVPGATPQAFLDRAQLASCGEFVLRQGESAPTTAMTCLENARGTTGAELMVTAPTVEGDPVVTWVRALPSGGLETWSDVSADRFAGEGVSWHYSFCPDATSLASPGECSTESFE